MHEVNLIFPPPQTTEAHLEDSALMDQRTKVFTGLQQGTKYCVSAMVEGKGALFYSDKSASQCLNLPEQGKNNTKNNIRN